MKLKKFAWLAIMAALSAAAWATTVIPIPVEELSRRATLIVEARALNSRSEWNAQHTLIFTYTTFQVTSTLKGASAPQIIVRQIGGKVDHTVVRVAGVQQWTPGEESVLFLRPSAADAGVMAVVGLMQGDYRVARINGATLVSNGVPKMKSYESEAMPAPSVSGGAMTLEQLEARVRKALE
jgi:hypothetical protein